MGFTRQQHRYLVALPRGEKQLFLSWRLLSADAPDAPFHVERRRGSGEEWQLVTTKPIVDSTNFLDETPEARIYQYRIIAPDGTPSEAVEVDAGATSSMLALDVPLNPDDDVQGSVIGELSNDGCMGYVLRVIRAGSVWMCAYRHDGKALWEKDTRLPSSGGWDGSTLHVPPDGSHWLNLTDWQRKNFVPMHWDEGPEVVFAIRKENKRIVRLLENGTIEDLPDGKLPEGGQYERNLVCADIIGDFRENIVTIDTEQHRLIVLVNPTLARRRGYSPYTHFEYQHDRSQHGSGYYIYLSPPDTIVNGLC